MLAGQRATPRLLENLSAPLFALLPAKWRLINAKDVAQAMLDQAFAPPQEGVTVLSSAQMQPTLRPWRRRGGCASGPLIRTKLYQRNRLIIIGNADPGG